MRAVSAGAWKPIEFSAATKSIRHCALRCRSSAACSRPAGAPDSSAARRSRRACPSPRWPPARAARACVLDRGDARLDLGLRVGMADLAGAAHVEQRAAHPVVGDLHRALALVRHVAIRAGDARARAEMPWLQSSNSGCWAFRTSAPGLRVLPVVETVAVGKLGRRRTCVRSVRPSAICLIFSLASRERCRLRPAVVRRRDTGRRRTSASPGASVRVRMNRRARAVGLAPALDALDVRRRLRRSRRARGCRAGTPGASRAAASTSDRGSRGSRRGGRPPRARTSSSVPPATGLDEPVFATSACAAA